MASWSMSADVIAGMLRIASQDLDGARLLNAAGNRNAAYLCEQAAEKVIRAVVPDANPIKSSLRALSKPDAPARKAEPIR